MPQRTAVEILPKSGIAPWEIAMIVLFPQSDLPVVKSSEAKPARLEGRLWRREHSSDAFDRPSCDPHTSAPASELSDEAALLCDGGKEGPAVLFRRYRNMIRGIAYKILRDSSEADDLVQDVFLLIHNKSATFDSSKGSARSWILTMAYRYAISRRRYLNSRHFYTALEIEDFEAKSQKPSREAQIAEEALDRRLQCDDLQRFFNSLSENQRLTLRLYFFEGYTLEEIAAKLGQPKTNIRHHYFRGLEKLRKQMFRGRSRR